MDHPLCAGLVFHRKHAAVSSFGRYLVRKFQLPKQALGKASPELVEYLSRPDMVGEQPMEF